MTHDAWWYAARPPQGEPVNVVPTKCEGWHWYADDALSDGMDDHPAATTAAIMRPIDEDFNRSCGLVDPWVHIRSDD